VIKRNLSRLKDMARARRYLAQQKKNTSGNGWDQRGKTKVSKEVDVSVLKPSFAII
jgi:hypothetical protein